MKKRIFAVILALMMILPLIASCVKNDGPSKESTTESASAEPSNSKNEEESGSNDPVESDTHQEVPSDYLSEYDLTGKTIKILYWEDFTMKEFFGEGNPSDEIDYAIYKRNNAVEERTKVKLEFIAEKGNADNMSKYIKKVELDFADSDNAAYDIFATYSRVSPTLSVQGYTADLMNLKPLDFSKPWWPKSLINECKIGNQLHFCSGDISTNMLWMMIGTFFNKQLLEDRGIEFPYELVKSGKWTTEVLKQMTQDIYEDADGDGEISDGDLFGYTIFDTNIDALGTSRKFTAVSRDKDGKLIINPTFFGDEMVDYMEMVQAWFTTAQGFYHSSKTNASRAPFYNGNALFITDRLFIAAGKDNASSGTEGIDFNFGVVPNPKFDEREEYCTNVGHPFTTYSISRKTNLKTETATVLELLAAEGYRYVTPAVFEVAMQLRYSKDSVDAEMYDMIRNNVLFEIGRLMCDTIGTTASNLFTKTVSSNSFSVTSFKVNKKIIQQGIDKVNEAYGLK